MSNIFKPKRSSTASSVPTTSNLSDGEMAVNTADQKIYVRSGNSIVTVADVGGGGGITDGDKGDISVTASGATWTIDNNAVTFAKMQQISTAKVLGRTASATGNVEQLSTTGTGNVVLSGSPIFSGNVSIGIGGGAITSKLHLQELSADTTIRITSGGLAGPGSINDWEITNFNANNTLSITNSSTARLSITTDGSINFTGSLYENNQKVPSLGVTLAASYGMFMP